MTTAQSGSAVRPAATSASLRRCSRPRAADSRSALPTSIVPRKIHGSSSNSARPRRDQVHLGLHINGPYPGRNCSRSQHDLERPSIPVSALRRSSGCPNEGNRALRMKTIESATATRLSANAVIGLVSVLSALRILKRASSLGHTYRSIGADNARPPGQDAAAPNETVMPACHLVTLRRRRRGTGMGRDRRIGAWHVLRSVCLSRADVCGFRVVGRAYDEVSECNSDLDGPGRLSRVSRGSWCSRRVLGAGVGVSRLCPRSWRSGICSG
jgi:hypothetical protein